VESGVVATVETTNIHLSCAGKTTLHEWLTGDSQPTPSASCAEKGSEPYDYCKKNDKAGSNDKVKPQ
jgi:hypothetical protein